MNSNLDLEKLKRDAALSSKELPANTTICSVCGYMHFENLNEPCKHLLKRQTIKNLEDI
jgi:hypothetical protein